MHDTPGAVRIASSEAQLARRLEAPRHHPLTADAVGEGHLTFEHDHAEPRARQRGPGRGAGDAPADDGHVDAVGARDAIRGVRLRHRAAPSGRGRESGRGAASVGLAPAVRAI
jgi:hypothetical protein